MPRTTSHLNALRAFEAAARHESFAKAATELSVSHTVISQHIRNLEGWLRAPLFVRHKNRVELTADGRMLAPRIAEAFQTIEDACDAFRHAPRTQIVEVVAEPALSARWLRRRIAGFHEKNPSIEVRLRSSWSPPSFKRAGCDLIIHFENRMPRTRSKTTRLFPIDGFPACSPDLIGKKSGRRKTVDVTELPLVHDHGHTIWRLWFDRYAPRSDAWQNGRVYSDLSLAIDAAVDGEGAILADEIICANELEAGALIKLDDRVVRCAWYGSVIVPDRTARPALETFQTWLHETASREFSPEDGAAQLE